MWYVVRSSPNRLLIPSKIMRPAPLDDMGVTIPDIFGTSVHSTNTFDDAKSLHIIDQAEFLLMRRRGEWKAHSYWSEVRQLKLTSMISSL